MTPNANLNVAMRMMKFGGDKTPQSLHVSNGSASTVRTRSDSPDITNRRGKASKHAPSVAAVARLPDGSTAPIPAMSAPPKR